MASNCRRRSAPGRCRTVPVGSKQVVSIAYVDTSAIASVVLRDTGWEDVAHRISGFSRVISSNLLEAELRAACHREGVPFSDDLLQGIDWVIPTRTLGPELVASHAKGYLRGADLWHVATALYAVRDPSVVAFLTLDRRQGAVAASLGFLI